MVAILHSIITDIENKRIKEKILVWQWKKNNELFRKIINEHINIFFYFRPRVSIFKKHMDRLKKKEFCWCRNY